MSSQVAVVVAIIAVAAVCLLVLLDRRGGEHLHLTPLAGVAFALIAAGIVFGEHRLAGYGLIAAGVALAVVDIVRRSRHRAA